MIGLLFMFKRLRVSYLHNVFNLNKRSSVSSCNDDMLNYRL